MYLRTLAAATLFTALAASAQSVTFDLQVNGKSIGKDVYKLTKSKQGYNLSSRYGYHVAGSEVDTSDDFKFTDDYAYVDGGSSSIATQLRSSYTPNKQRTELTVGTVQGGVQGATSLPIKPNFTMLPNYDAGAAQVFLLWTVAKPVETHLYNIVIPGSGTAAPPPGTSNSDDPTQPVSRGQSGNLAYDAGWNVGKDATGTLDGQPVKLHSYFLAAGKFRWTFYADESNTLMQLDNSLAHASYIRQKFKLDPVAP